MIYYTIWIVAVTVLLISCTDSRAFPEDHLSEIDKDLASILSQAADGPADTHAKSPIDKSDEDLKSDVSRRFGSNVPQDNNDDGDTTLNEFLDYLKSDRNDGSDVPAKELLDNLDSDYDEPIPTDILDDLESGKRQRPSDSVSVFLEDLKDQSDKKERIAKKLFDILNKDKTHRSDDVDGVPAKELLNSIDSEYQDNDDEPMPKELLDDLESGKKLRPRNRGFENSEEESILKKLVDDLNQDARKKYAAKNTDCGLQCKKEALRDILMDELVSRMTTIAKRGDKIPKRMLDLWKKYRTKRENIESNAKTSSLMM